MSAQPDNIKAMPGQRRPMEVSIRGKIEAARRHEKKHYTRLVTPAADEYSRPQTVEIRSNNRVGQMGDLVSVDCKLGGYTRKPFKSTDKETGEISMVTPVDMTLDAIE
ncbi:single-stranded DNA-binding protein [Polaromonas sp.]|uniref:single-stranded DNA-binding protein n=1 Tax=Polaromonas sp. TaxID=1869339 RepID=UPI003266038A